MMLLSLRQSGLVQFLAGVERATNGRPAGHYFGTEKGRRYLESLGYTVPTSNVSQVALETGAMRGEVAEVLRRPAVDGTAPRGAIASVWDLATTARTVQEPRQTLPAPLHSVAGPR